MPSISDQIIAMRGTVPWFAPHVAPPVVCPDGTVLSIQASENHHCSPRTDHPSNGYETFELMPIELPNGLNSELLPYSEYDIDIYYRVPAAIIERVLKSYGYTNTNNLVFKKMPNDWEDE